MYAKLWDEDRQTKSKREEMEAALQIERNREMLKVVYTTTLLSYVLLVILLHEIDPFI